MRSDNRCGMSETRAPYGTDHGERVNSISEETEFYVVIENLKNNISKWHGDYESAVSEAKRLCRKVGKTFRVLRVVAVIEPTEPKVTEVKS